MERLPHPTYVRRTAAVTFGLVAAGLACLALGVVVRQTAWRNAETILNLFFAATVVALAVRWFTVGDAAPCPRCGQTLAADTPDDPASPTFTCPDCQVQWVAQADANA